MAALQAPLNVSDALVLCGVVVDTSDTIVNGVNGAERIADAEELPPR